MGLCGWEAKVEEQNANALRMTWEDHVISQDVRDRELRTSTHLTIRRYQYAITLKGA